MQYENLCTSKSFATLGSNNEYFRKEVPSVRCILESSSRCPNILTVAPPNNLVLRVPCRPPIIPVCGRTYHAVCLKSRWPSLGAYFTPAFFYHSNFHYGRSSGDREILTELRELSLNSVFLWTGQCIMTAGKDDAFFAQTGLQICSDTSQPVFPDFMQKKNNYNYDNMVKRRISA